MHLDRFENGGCYFSEIGLYEFQELGVAEAYLRGDALAIWDTGIGKSHLGMATSALLFEDDLVDLIVVICEGNKTDEWVADFHRFTTLEPFLYHGTDRHSRLLKESPQVVVSTYDTFKRDCATFVVPPGKVRKVGQPGILTDWLDERRIYFIFDEITRLKNRLSGVYKSIEYALGRARSMQSRALGLTATPVDTTPENVFNICRLLDPGRMPSVSEFEKKYAMGRDGFGRLVFKQNKLAEFHALIRPMLMRKRKSDPDVVDQFPKQVEESMHIDMHPDQAELYHTVAAWEVPEHLYGAQWGLLRQIAAYPDSVNRSVNRARAAGEAPSELGEYLVREWGSTELERVSSAKAERLVDYLKLLVLGQGEKVLVFTYFGPSVGPLLARDLREAKIKVYSHHPPMTAAEMTEKKQAFRQDPHPGVLLSSDAGARGMNLPEASYVIHYEMPLTFSTYRQRSDRNHRIDSKLPSVTSTALILRNTVEEDIAETCMKRNGDQDVILGDTLSTDHVLAEERRQLLRIKGR